MTSFLSTSSFLFSFKSSAVSAWIAELSSPWDFLRLSMYCASSSASSSKVPSMSSVVVGPGILSVRVGICLEDVNGWGSLCARCRDFVEGCTCRGGCVPRFQNSRSRGAGLFSPTKPSNLCSLHCTTSSRCVLNTRTLQERSDTINTTHSDLFAFDTNTLSSTRSI